MKNDDFQDIVCRLEHVTIVTEPAPAPARQSPVCGFYLGAGSFAVAGLGAAVFAGSPTG
jgi:hypothetical protein